MRVFVRATVQSLRTPAEPMEHEGVQWERAGRLEMVMPLKVRMTEGSCYECSFQEETRSEWVVASFPSSLCGSVTASVTTEAQRLKRLRFLPGSHSKSGDTARLGEADFCIRLQSSFYK